MKKFVFAICAALTLIGANSVYALIPEFDYVFEPSSTDLPPLDGWGGSLFLDASSSPVGGGSLTDINMAASYLTTPFGTFNLDQATDVTSDEPFTWTPTGITSMDISGAVVLDEGGLAGDESFQWEITDSSVAIELPDPYADGKWVSAISGVPDSASTAALIGLAATGLFGFEYFSRTRKLAMARR
jgi:hypothetical protein